MSDSPDQHSGREAKRHAHLKLVESAFNEVFDDGQGEDQDESEPMPWDVSAEEESSAGSPEPQSYRNKYALTAKQETFCQAMLRGVATQSDGYREAYNTENMSDATIHKEACALMANPKVAGRLDAGFAEKEAKELHAEASRRDYVVRGLQHEAEHATSDAARVRAFELLGKTIAMFADKVQHEEPDMRSAAEVKADIETRLRQVFGNTVTADQ